MIATYLKQKGLPFFIVIAMLLGVHTVIAQELNNFEIRYQSNLRGDLTFIGNNILNRDSGTSGEGVNDAYNNLLNDESYTGNNDVSGATNFNDFKNMQYIDVDSDPTTFSSSSSTFAFPQANCNLIRYAGLYWTATYPSETANGTFDETIPSVTSNTIAPGTNRETDFNQVKFQVPGGAYVDIVADEILFDGFLSTDPEIQANSPYSCYADVTSLVTALADPTGDYTVANIRATTGQMTGQGGSAGGWTLVIVYENPTLTGKLISTFDGFARINDTNSIDIPYSGFETIPVGPVNVSLGAGTLEGDFRIVGDGLSIQADSNTGFTTLGNSANPTDNFFNSNITLNSAITTNRNPASLNTLGYDTDIFLLSNPVNSVIPNGETGAVFRFSTDGDQYYPFFNSFNVEIIEPNIFLEKRVEDIGGNDITGQGVNLGQTLDYVLTFGNIGNDDARDFTIRDVFPVNTTFMSVDVSGAPGVTYVFDALTNEITFTVPDDLVEEGDPTYPIRIEVRVAENCFDFVDACTDLIENLAFSTYRGDINTAVITDDPSVSDFDNCGFVTPGATNFLLDDLNNCNFSRTVQLCGADVLLDAGNGFDNYVWVRDDNNNGVIDATDTVLNDGDPDSDPSTFLVDDIGVYIVDKQIADPCKGFSEIITVERFGTTQFNPITALINDTTNTIEGEVLICPNDGDELPQIFLCGSNDTELIQLNIPDAESIVWELLDEGSCAPATADCANKNNTCTWNTVATGGDFTADASGQYRVVVNYQNGCFSRFFFNVFKNTLDIEYTSRDIVCETPGNITVTNLGSNYGYQLVNTGSPNNVALNKNTSQSSTAFGGDSSRAVDGNTNGTYGFNSVTHTSNAENNPWWRVDLGEQFNLTSINVFNRTDCCSGRLNGAEIYVGSIDSTDPADYTQITTLSAAAQQNLTGLALTGRYIMVRQTIGRILSIAELQAIGRPVGFTEIVVPFSADNGPSFDVLDNGSYRVDVVQLDASGNPIPNSCVFQTEEIGILRRDITATVTPAPANCNVLGQINIQALNVFPNYEYELRLDDGSPNGTLVDSETAQADNNFTFTNVNPGNYIVITRTDDGCEDIQNVTVTAIPDPTLAALTTADISCDPGFVDLTRTGGQGNPDFLFAIWSKDGVLLHSPGGSPTEQEVIDNIDPNAYQVGNTFQFGWRDTDGDGTNEYFPGEDGDYVFIVIDANNCYALSNPVTVNDLGVLSVDSINEVQPSCSGEPSGALTINISGGVGPYQYSIDNGATYQPNPVFPGLPAGNYEIRVLDSGSCDVSQSYVLNQPFPLSASAGVSRDATCDPSNGGEVRVTNVVGGIAPYEYSFNGGTSYGPSSIATLPPGDYTVLVRDASLCSFSMDVTVDALPAPPNVALTPEVNYNCDGTGTITASPSISGYDYRYQLDGVDNAPDPSSNVFANVPAGTYTVTTFYTNSVPPTPSLLLNEDFGNGDGTIPSPDTLGYRYEDQTTSTAGGGDANTRINDFEYSVTNRMIAPFGSWVNPLDQTSLQPDGTADPNGRFLVINVGTPSPGQIIYTKTINDVIPNRPLRVSLYIFNLLNGLIGNTQLDPDLTIEITDTAGTVIQSIRTGDIPKNTGPEDWTNFTTDFDPGANTTLEFIIRSEISGNSGNDLAIDDIRIFQIPEVCELFVATPVTVEAGRRFESSVLSHTNSGCNGLNNGTVTFEVNNFNVGSGFEYSIDGGAFIAATSSPITTDPILGPGNHTIEVRKTDEITCTTTISQNITEPTAVIASASVTTGLSCTSDATITASGSGGLPGYVYQLEDNAGGIIGAFDFATNGNNTAFTGLTDGTYVVRVQDSNGCEDVIDAPLVIAPTNPVVFDITETDCYAGGNSASIQVNVTDGNGGYQFRINAGPWLTPSPTSATTFTFNNLSSGPYAIDVRDQLGCPNTLATQSVTIEPELTVSATADNLSVCDTDTPIVISANGGDGNYVYSIVNAGATPTDASFNTTNPVTGFTAGTYDVYVRDNNGDVVAGFCEDFFTLTITQDAPINFTATPTDVVCNGDATGSIAITVNSGGEAPFVYSIDGGATYGTSNTFPNLATSNYQVRVRDTNGCEAVIQNIRVNEPLELTASAAVVSSVECNPGMGAEVRITNPNGGTPGYEYSFDAGLSYNATTVGFLPAGTHSLFIRDANLCTSEMTVVVAPALTPPTVDPAIDYNCDGTGNVTFTPDNLGFDYTYELGGTSQTSNIFNDIPVGTHTVTVGYISNAPAPTSVIFSEDFGSGPTTAIPQVDPRFCFEPLDGTLDSCGNNSNASLNNGEYTVTQEITGSWSGWRSPNDHTGNTDGRFLAIDLGTVVGLDGIIYAKRGVTVIPNRDLTVTMELYNLVRDTHVGPQVDPDVRIELLDAGGIPIIDGNTGDIPRNTNADDWHFREITLNPGSNTTIDIVLRTAKNTNTGNDLAIDDIAAFQTIEQCEGTTTFDIIIEDGNAFDAAITAFQNLDCNGDASGSITIDAENFGAGGFEYSVDGGAFQGPFTTAQTITGLAAGNRNIVVRDVDNPTSCSTTLTQNLSEPLAVDATAVLTEDISCVNGGATITASATGGTPTYEYQLEDDMGNIITGYDFATNGNNPVFTGITVAGDYHVRVMDSNTCSDLTDVTVTVTDPEAIVFDVTPTPCYSGTNDASLLINVTNGNGGYQFRLNGGPWITPSPTTATSHTFDNLSNGSYTVEVRDQLGCPITPNVQTIAIDPQLVVSLAVDDLSACTDGMITVTANGGNGTLVYAFVPANTSPAGLFSTSNTFAVTEAIALANPSGFDVHVLDNNGASPSCSFLQEDIVFTPVPTLSGTPTPTNPECHDGLGLIDMAITGGTAPYAYAIADLSPADGVDYGSSTTNIFATNFTFNGVGVGDYQITVTDNAGCSITTSTVTVSNATEITTDILPILPANCDDPANTAADFGFLFDNVTAPTGTIEYSDDGGMTWQTSNELRGNLSGTEVFPSIRVTLGSGTVCQRDFDRYIIPFPLDDLDITLSAVIVGCNDLRVTVEGSQGDGSMGYDYTYTDDPANFNTFILDPNVWVNNVPSGTAHTFQNIDPTTPQYPEVPLLIPGRTYVFYVRDGAGCIRQSNVNVNEIPGIGLPIDITEDVTPSCNGSANGSITFNLNPTTAHPSFRWEIYALGGATPIEVSGGGATAVNVPYTPSITTTTPLAIGEYYIDVIQVDGSNVDACRGASENAFVPELAPLSANATLLRDISCNLPGLISVESISGGGGAPYTYDVSGPVGFTALTGTTDNPVQIPVNSPAGDYTVTLYDQFSCPLVLNPVTLSLSPNPTITVSQDNCTSPITVTAVGNSVAGNFRYAIVPNGDPAPTTFLDNSGAFSNVAPGSYDVYVRDGNGCLAVETAFEVHPVLSASATLTKTLDCTAAPDAVISIAVLDGSGTYRYSISNTAGAPAITNLPVPSNAFDYNAPLAGEYTVTIFDTNTPNTATCNRSFVVNVPDRIEPVIDPNIVVTHITCDGDSDGTITIATTNNAAAPYSFEITVLDGGTVSILPTSTTATSATFTGLAPTNNTAVTEGYVVTVTGDAATNNCAVDSAPIPINNSDAIVVTMDTPVDFGCTTGNNVNNASISVSSVSGGSGTFVRYQFFDSANLVTPLQDGSNDTYIETDTNGGSYVVRVFDNNGCFGETTETIAPFDELLPATVTVDNAITCLVGENITINSFGSLTDSSTPAGLANYNFRELPGGIFGASNTFANLGEGTHNFEVLNVNTGCVLTVSHNVTSPNNFEIDAATTDVRCFGEDGTVSFTISDPINPYTGGFSWQIYNTMGTVDTADDTILAGANGTSVNTGPTAPFNIGAGTYRVEVVQDSNPDCTESAFFTIASPAADITASRAVSGISCAPGNDGVIELTNVQGGWGSYLYYVDTTPNPDEFDSTNYTNNPRFENLGVGTYEIWIIDQNGCPERLADETLDAPTPIIADLRTNVGNCTDFSGEIEVVGIPATDPISGGQGANYTYQLFRNSMAVGSPQNTRIFNGLGEGSYTVEVRDQLGCTLLVGPQVLFDVIAPATNVVKTIDCNSGAEITVTQTGGSGSFDYEVRFPGTLPIDPADASNTTGVFTGLNLVGDYVFTVTDQATGHTCSMDITQNLQDRVEPQLQIDTFANTTCSGANDGTISLSANPDNGIGPYTFTIISGPGSTATFPIAATSATDATAVFTGLEGTLAGITYTIRITSPNGCSNDITQTITEPETISNVMASATQFGCAVGNNNNSASITVDVASITGGSGNYVRFEFINTDTGVTVQDDSNPTYVETDFAGGTYEIFAYDDRGCRSLAATEGINPFVGIQDPVVTDIAPVTCNPGSDAQIQVDVTLNPTSGTPNLLFTVSGINVTYNDSNATGLFTGLPVGIYSISIANLDADPDCIIETVHTIEEPELMEVVATKLTDEECLNNGVDDGSFNVTVGNYVGNYDYQVFDTNRNPIAGQSGSGNTATALAPFTNLSGGSYFVTVTQTDAPFCVVNSNAITITAPDAPITAIINEEESVSCTNDQGRLLVSAAGGFGPYTITINNTTTGQSFTESNSFGTTFMGLSGGDYVVTVTDASGCVFTDTVELTRPNDIAATLNASALVCFGDDDASVTATIAPRNVPAMYEYELLIYADDSSTTPTQISSGQASATFDNLGPGFYEVRVTDNNGCSTETNRLEITNPTVVNAQLVLVTPLSCSTQAVLELTASGGTGPYEYSEDGINFMPMNEANGPNTHVFTNLGDGTYSYFVMDSSNCLSISSNEVTEDAIEPLELFVNDNAAQINCNGEATAIIFADADGGVGNYQYELYTDSSLSATSRIAGPQQLGEFRDLPQGDYYVNVISGDCTANAIHVPITEPTPLTFTENVSDPSCAGEENGSITVTLAGGAGGYQYAISPNLNQFDVVNTFTNLAAGDYTIIAQDQNGCFEVLDYTLVQPDPIQVSVASQMDEVCVGSEDGLFELEIIGGTAPYSTSLNSNQAGNFVQDQFLFENLAAGTYVVFVVDGQGCETDIIVEINPGVNLNATVTPIYECSGAVPDNSLEVVLEDSSVANDVLYNIDSADPATMRLNPDFTGLTPGMHTLTIAHSNGCINEIDFMVQGFEPLVLSLEQNNINEITAVAQGGLEDYTFYFGDVDNGTDNTFIINRTDTYTVRLVDTNGCESTADIFIEFIDIEFPDFFTPDGDGLNDVWVPRNQEGFPNILTIIFDRYGRELYRMNIDSDPWDGLYQNHDLPTGDYWYVIKLQGETDDREFVGHFTLYR